MGSKEELNVLLIRHATPDWMRTDLDYHIPPGPPLTEQGKREAGALGAYLHQVSVSHLYSSPLERCWRTAEIAAQIAAVPLEVEWGLIEWQKDEDQPAVRKRMGDVFKTALEIHAGNSPLGLVTHGGPIAMLLEVLGMDAATLESWRKFDHRNPVPCAGVWQATRDGEGWNLRLVFKPTL